MKVTTFPLGQLQANCYLLEEDDNCIIIDPGDSADFLSEEIQRRNLQLLAVVATHGHFDHVMAVGELQLSYKVPFYIHQDDLFLIKRLAETAEYFLDYKPQIIPPQNIVYLEQGILKISGWELEVITTPGHTPGSCCFYFKGDKVIFTGDTLFKEGIGRYDFKYSSKEQLKQSLQKLFTLDDIITVCAGHGEETLLHMEKENVATYL